ncbi:MAG TPA: amino acid adenylation domain-containing protein, partial [Symbiobacteriaceae bacterium]|nr:amino acid adenylation domain-containing protein [Symbiobacteriaceae bacterium]
MENEALSKRIAALSPAQQALLAKKLAGVAQQAPRSQAIPRHTNSEGAPLTPGQLGLWFIHEVEPDNAAYHIPIAMRFTGRLDLQALQASLNAMLSRHEALRTVFRMQEGGPKQWVSPHPAFPLQVIDLPGAPSQGEEIIADLAKSEAQRPFDLANGPLCRATLWRLGPDDHLLVITVHHIVADLWSVGMMVSDLAAAYRAIVAGAQPDLPALPIQFGDYAHWLIQRISSPELQSQAEYWRKALQGSSTAADLTTDRPRTAATGPRRGQRQLVHIPAALSAAVRQLGQQGITPYMVLLAAWEALLCRYSGQDNFTIGTAVANRNRPETMNLVGFFVNTLALRADLTGNPTLGEVLTRVRQVTLDGFAHQDLPFESLVESLQLHRTWGRTPLFQVMFNLQNTKLPELNFPGVVAQPINVDLGTSKFDMTLDITAGEETFAGYLEYDTHLYDPVTVNRLADQYLVMLSALVQTPEVRLWDLPLVTPPAPASVAQPTPPLTCVHQTIEAQAMRHPEAPAITDELGEVTLSFEALNARANQVAHALRSLGVGPEVLVGVCLERSIEAAVAMLAVLKVGGVYVPLGPDNPASRLAYMTEDTQIPVLVTEQRLLPKVPEHQARVLCLDSDGPLIDQQRTENPPPLTDLENAAYIIYTSGSTGRPKGTVITHRALASHSQAIREAFQLTSTDRVLHFASFNFDVSIEQLLPPLVHGACIVMRNPDVWGLNDVSAKLAQLGITVANFPTAYWHQWTQVLAQSGSERADTPLRLMIVGGEALHPKSVQLWQEQCYGDVRLLNAYGPTETTITATTWAATPNTDWSRFQRSVPIGQPLVNRLVYVLDRVGNPVPPGVWGELHIGGDSLARGYWNRPDLTAERFVPNPFGATPGERFYRTGDVVRLLPDGSLEFAGRQDDQVKLRGYRIELGEIEAVLREHPHVHEAVVLLRDEEPRQLAAYVVPASTEVTSPAAAGDTALGPRLRTYLQTRLPEYMVPAAVLTLAQLPLNNNGKVDRRQLPALPDLGTALADAYVAPRSEAETALARIWAEVLRVDRVGIHDNFFALGGDSIMAIQVVARAGQAGLKLTPKDLMQQQTVASLAQVVRVGTTPQADQGLMTGDVPLTPIQRSFFAQSLANPHHHNQAFVLQTAPGLDCGALEQALQALVQHHDALRLRYVLEEGLWRQFYAAPEAAGQTKPLVTRHDVSGLAEPDRGAHMAAIASHLQASLHISDGPGLAAVLFDHGPATPGQLVLAIHHLLVDGVSWRILLEDLDTAYGQLAQGRPIVLPPKTSSYKTWAEGLTQYAQSPQVARQA